MMFKAICHWFSSVTLASIAKNISYKIVRRNFYTEQGRVAFCPTTCSEAVDKKRVQGLIIPVHAVPAILLEFVPQANVSRTVMAP